jgi:hypothetical protein
MPIEIGVFNSTAVSTLSKALNTPSAIAFESKFS